MLVPVIKPARVLSLSRFKPSIPPILRKTRYPSNGFFVLSYLKLIDKQKITVFKSLNTVNNLEFTRELWT